MHPSSLLFILPLHNEERITRVSCETLLHFLHAQYEHGTWQIVLADNGSTDATPTIVDELVKEHPERVRAYHSPVAGRGRTLRTILVESDTDISCYIDADLPIPLEELPTILSPIEGRSAEMTVGQRMGDRPWMRRILTHAFSFATGILFGLRVRDAQCGVKAFSRRTIRELVPFAQENGFFLDTELLCLAKKHSFPIREIPIHWIERRYAGRTSSVRLFRDSCRAIAALLRIRRLVRQTRTSS